MPSKYYKRVPSPGLMDLILQVLHDKGGTCTYSDVVNYRDVHLAELYTAGRELVRQGKMRTIPMGQQKVKLVLPHIQVPEPPPKKMKKCIREECNAQLPDEPKNKFIKYCSRCRALINDIQGHLPNL